MLEPLVPSSCHVPQLAVGPASDHAYIAFFGAGKQLATFQRKKIEKRIWMSVLYENYGFSD